MQRYFVSTAGRRQAGARLLAVAAALAFGASVAHSQSGQPVKVVVPYAAGGVTDQAARVLAERMSQILGQPFVVENRPGAGSRLGAQAVADGPADGSQLLFTNISFSTLPLADRSVKYDPLKSFAPVGLAAVYGAILVVKPALPARDLRELVELARKNPGKLSYGSAGMGSGAHFVGEYFKSLTGSYVVHIPYRSTSAALTDVAGGLVDWTIDATAKPLIDAGKVRPLAIIGAQRDPRLPDVPTAAEAGLKGLDFNAWVGLMAHASTPAPVLERLNKAMATALEDPAVRRRYLDMGLIPRGGPAARLTEQLRDDAAKYRKVIEQARIKFDQG
jgi:tripartite-type tricarboxylate transporter receptor subunit TctC